MAKRQLRISGSGIPQKWPEISGKKVNIVLTSGVVLMGKMLQLVGPRLTYQNMRLKTQEIAVDQVAEIILDY